MPGELLVDAGALVALLDRSQPDHQACVEVLDRWDGALLSAVLTEATHLLERVRGGGKACLEIGRASCRERVYVLV